MIEHEILLTFAVVTIVVTVSGFAFMGWLLFASHRLVRDSQNLVRAVGMLVIQETAKLPGKAG